MSEESQKTLDESIKEGDYVLVDYIGRYPDEKGEQTVFDVTIEEEAKKAHVWRENVTYQPELAIVGKGYLVKGLENALVGMEVGKTVVVEVTPEDGFGKRDPKSLERIAVPKLRKMGVEKIHPGARVQIKGKIGYIKNVMQGKALVDYNHPYAGKTLYFETTVREKITDREEQIKALIQRRVPGLPKDQIKLEFDENDPKKVTIQLSHAVLFMQSLYYVKAGIAFDMKDHQGLEKVYFVYEFDNSEKKEEAPKETEDEEKAPEESTVDKPEETNSEEN